MYIVIHLHVSSQACGGMKKKNQQNFNINNFCVFKRELDGHGHFETITISRRKVLYDNLGKYSNLKLKFVELFFTK